MGVPARPGEHNVVRVVDQRVRRDDPLVQSGTVAGQGFDGGAGRTGGSAVVHAAGTDRDSAVETKVNLLFPDTAAEGENASVIGVHHHDGALELLLIAAALRHLLRIGIEIVDDILNPRVDAAVDLITAAVKQLLGGFKIDALGAHQIPDHITDDDFFVVGVDLLVVFLIRGPLEHQRLLHRALPGVIVDIALFIHLAENNFLTVLVVLLIVERVIISGLVGDADDGGTLRQTQILDVLAEICMGGNPHTPASFAEIDRIEVPLQDFLLVVFLFQLQGTEDLGQFPGDRDLVLSGEVFQQLLGDGRAAVTGLHTGEHLDKSARSAVPVDPLMLIEALVLNGDQGLLHILRDFFILDPDAALISADGDALLPFSRQILFPDGTGLTQLIVLQRDVQFRCEAGFDIVGKDAGKECARHQQNQKESADDAEDRDEDGGERVDGIPACPQKTPGCTALFQLFFRGRISRSHRVSRHFRCSSGDEIREKIASL